MPRREPMQAMPERGRRHTEDQPLLKNRHLAMIAGGLVLAAAAAYGLVSENNNDNKPVAGKSLPSASALPQPVETEPTQPSPTLSPTPTETASSEPADPYYSERTTIAQLFRSCNIINFTNDGVVSTAKGKRVKLNLDMDIEKDPASVDLRSRGQTNDLRWNGTKIVAAPLDREGQPHKKGQLVFPYNGPNSSIFMPSKTGDWAVGLRTSAQTPIDGDQIKTTEVFTYCDTVYRDEEFKWDKRPDSTSIEEFTVHETTLPRD